MMQYLPMDGLYVYFRYDANQTVMCVMNTSENEKKIQLADYAERTKGFNSAKDVLSNKNLGNSFTIPAKTMWVLSLEK
jgi:hypothetical protein